MHCLFLLLSLLGKSIEFLESMLKIILPAIGESFHHKHSPEQFGTVLFACIESNDIAHFYAMWVFFDQFDSITSSDFTLLQHGEIEPRAFAC